MWLYHCVLMSLVTDAQSPLSLHMTNCSDRQRAEDSEARLTIVRSAQAGVTANNVVAASWEAENVSLCSQLASAHTIPHTSPLPTLSYLPVPFCSMLSLGTITNDYTSDFEFLDNICMWINLSIYVERRGYMVRGEVYGKYTSPQQRYMENIPLLSRGICKIYPLLSKIESWAENILSVKAS